MFILIHEISENRNILRTFRKKISKKVSIVEIRMLMWKCQVNEKLDRKFRLIEFYINFLDFLVVVLMAE